MTRIVDSFRGLILGLSLILMPLATAGVAMAQDSTELQKQLAKALVRSQQLQLKAADLEAAMAKGQAVADQLRAENEQLKKALAQREQQAAERIAAGRYATSGTEAAMKRMAALQQEVEALRQALAKLQSERDKNLKTVVELTDQLHQAFNELKRLKELNARLSALLPKPPENVLEGVVTAVQENGLVEISLGSDDGLLNGHRLSVYRTEGSTMTPLGQLDVINAVTDKSVCKVDPNSLKSPLEKGDRVTSGNPPRAFARKRRTPTNRRGWSTARYWPWGTVVKWRSPSAPSTA